MNWVQLINILCVDYNAQVKIEQSVFYRVYCDFKQVSTEYDLNFEKWEIPIQVRLADFDAKEKQSETIGKKSD